MKHDQFIGFHFNGNRIFLSTLLSTLCSFFATTQVYAIKITDYTEPESTYQEAFLSGKTSTQSGNQDQMSFDASLSGDYEKNYSSRERNMQLLLDGFYNSSRGADDLDSTESSYEVNAGANIDNYMKNMPNTFWFGGSDIKYKDSSDDVFMDITGGFGYGRITNATPLARAMRVIEELQEHQLISSAIPDIVYLDLAQIINRETEFRSRYGAEEYKAKFIQALEEVLQTHSIIQGNLSAAGVVHMQRVLFDERISTRKYGWLVRGGVGVIANDFAGDSGDPTVVIEAEYAKPLNPYSQLINRFSYSALIKGGDQNDQLISNRLSYTYELSDNIDWENSWNLTLELADNSASNDITTNSLASTFRYYLTNQLAADATIALVKLDDDIDNNGNDDSRINTFLGITYRLK